jgi:opacity protein-like surface antigen
MMRTFLITAVSAVALSTAAWAQDAGQTAADVREQPVTQSLNTTEASTTKAEVATTTAQQDQYELDRAAFRAEVVSRREKIEMDQEAYAKQQSAYADAMIAWRIQNDECKRGILKSCKKPTPVPADFYRP